MTSSPAPTPAHEHEYHALWSHLGPLGRQDIHYHPCTEAEPGECHAVLVGYGVDCDGKRATHAACELPVPDDLVIPGEPQPEPPAPTPAHEHVWTRCPNCPAGDGPCACSGVACCDQERAEIAAEASAPTPVGAPEWLAEFVVLQDELADRIPALVGALEGVIEQAQKWAALAPPGPWTADPADAVLADAGRSLLDLITTELAKAGAALRDAQGGAGGG